MSLENTFETAKKIGNALAILHDANLTHGDLTTSNMMIRDSSGSLVSHIFLSRNSVSYLLI
jgi:tRNA A-37 threonylcarbamoyl transferase component Bud32